MSEKIENELNTVIIALIEMVRLKKEIIKQSEAEIELCAKTIAYISTDSIEAHQSVGKAVHKLFVQGVSDPKIFVDAIYEILPDECKKEK